MDILTILRYALAIVESGCLFAALVFSFQAIHENKKNHGAFKKENMVKAGIFFAVYLILNRLRNYFF